jgi:hypothetical protein
MVRTKDQLCMAAPWIAVAPVDSTDGESCLVNTAMSQPPIHLAKSGKNERD